MLLRTCNLEYLPVDGKPTQQSTIDLGILEFWNFCCELAPWYCMSVQAVLMEAMKLGYNRRSDASMPGNNAQHQLHSLQQNEPRDASAGENSMPLGTFEGTVINWSVLHCSVKADHDVSTA